MSVNVENEKLRIRSIEPKNRPGRTALVSIFIFAWLLAIIWYAAAWAIFTEAPMISIFVVLVNSAYVGYLGRASIGLRRKLNNTYILEVDQSTIHFSEYDFYGENRSVWGLSFDEIVSCEYYAYKNSGSVVLRSRTGTRLEIPVWCFPEKGKQLIKFLKNRGLEVNDVRY